MTIDNTVESFNAAVSKAQTYFPGLNIQYKDESLLMKFLAKILFFNPKFMEFTTTLGSTIYLPSKVRLGQFPIGATVTLLHELSHIYNSKKKTGFIFSLLYLCPQLLFVIGLPIFFLFGLMKALLCLLFLLPIPSYTRMIEERQAYTISLYALNKLNNMGFHTDLDVKRDEYIAEFSGPSYYFMWWLPGMEAYFDTTISQIQLGEQPNYDQALYQMIDNVLKS